MTPLKRYSVCMLASEVAPLSKTGGLADVAGALGHVASPSVEGGDDNTSAANCAYRLGSAPSVFARSLSLPFKFTHASRAARVSSKTFFPSGESWSY